MGDVSKKSISIHIKNHGICHAQFISDMYIQNPIIRDKDIHQT